MSQRLACVNRRNHVTEKVRIAAQPTFYLSFLDEQPAEIFLRVKRVIDLSEFIGLYGVIARRMSLSLQHGARYERLCDLLAGAKSAPFSQMSRHDRPKSCTSLPDLIGRHPLVEYCGRYELAHVPLSTTEEAP